ncbi:hypothetical protein ACQPXM_33140 [Kribbella sp. CA-253562]|uniref:hypothetical protein n=1 Tax=Kribbella sp. CA-253562 TaxID=3239942 RepID=UPI003D8B091D
MRLEPRVGCQFAGSDLEPQSRLVTLAQDPALADIGGALSERADEREHNRACVPYASPLAAPLEVEDERVLVVGRGGSHSKSPVVLTPSLDMRQEMVLGLLSDPQRLLEGREKITRTRDQPLGVPDATAGFVILPPGAHVTTVPGPLMPQSDRSTAG